MDKPPKIPKLAIINGQLSEIKKSREMSLPEWKSLSNSFGIVGLFLWTLLGIADEGTYMSTGKTLSQHFDALKISISDSLPKGYSMKTAEGPNGKTVTIIKDTNTQQLPPVNFQIMFPEPQVTVEFRGLDLHDEPLRIDEPRLVKAPTRAMRPPGNSEDGGWQTEVRRD